MHRDIDFVQETTTINSKGPEKKNLVDILKTANLMQYNDLFIKENIDLDILKGLNDDECMDMFNPLNGDVSDSHLNARGGENRHP